LNFTDQTRENFGALFILSAFAMHNIFKLGMACHSERLAF
jgi:hypothetical protein